MFKNLVQRRPPQVGIDEEHATVIRLAQGHERDWPPSASCLLTGPSSQSSRLGARLRLGLMQRRRQPAILLARGRRHVVVDQRPCETFRHRAHRRSPTRRRVPLSIADDGVADDVVSDEVLRARRRRRHLGDDRRHWILASRVRGCRRPSHRRIHTPHVLKLLAPKKRESLTLRRKAAEHLLRRRSFPRRLHFVPPCREASARDAGRAKAPSTASKELACGRDLGVGFRLTQIEVPTHFLHDRHADRILFDGETTEQGVVGDDAHRARDATRALVRSARWPRR